MALDRNEADRVSDIERLPRRPDADAGSVGDNLEVQRADAALVQHLNADEPHRSRLGVRKLDCRPLRQRRRRPTYAMAPDVRRHFLGHARLLVLVWIWLAGSFGGTSASISGGSLLGNHHPPWEFTGMLRPRWRCPALRGCDRTSVRSPGLRPSAGSTRSDNSWMWAEATKKGECQDGPDGVADHRRGVRQIVSSGHPNLW